jgi:hypothetical protein
MSKQYLNVGLAKPIYQDMKETLKELKKHNNSWSLGRMLNAAMSEFLKTRRSKKQLDQLFHVYEPPKE